MQRCPLKNINKLATNSSEKNKIVVTISPTEKKKNTAIVLAGAVINEPLPKQILDCLKNNPVNYVILIFEYGRLMLTYFGEKNGATMGLSVKLSENVSFPNIKLTGNVVTAKVNCIDLYDELKFYYTKPDVNIPICLAKGEKSVFLQIDSTKLEIID